jgi:uncharacterized protein
MPRICWHMLVGWALIRCIRSALSSSFPLTPVLTDPFFWLVIIPAVTFLGLSKGGFAGVGMASTPLVALVLPPLKAAAILLPILLVQDAISVYVYRRDWSAWNLKVLTPGAVIGVIAAWLLAAHVSEAFVRLAIGAIGIVFSLNTWLSRLPQKVAQPTAASGVFWGVLSGFTSTFAQVGAPPFQIHVLPQRLEKMTLVGTTAIFFASVNLMKVVPYFSLGQFSREGLSLTLLLLPLAIATNFLGIWLVRRTPTVVFYKVAHILVLVISVVLLAQGAYALAR